MALFSMFYKLDHGYISLCPILSCVMMSCLSIHVLFSPALISNAFVLNVHWFSFFYTSNTFLVYILGHCSSLSVHIFPVDARVRVELSLRLSQSNAEVRPNELQPLSAHSSHLAYILMLLLMLFVLLEKMWRRGPCLKIWRAFS